jgi:hypothetical protein
MKLGVTGTRFCNNYQFVKSVLNRLFPDKSNIEMLISGHARGIDLYCEMWATENKIPIDSHPPDWKKYGKGAAFIRNKDIVDNADCMVGFPLSEGHSLYPSRGTNMTIDIAKKQNKPVTIIPVPLIHTTN